VTHGRTDGHDEHHVRPAFEAGDIKWLAVFLVLHLYFGMPTHMQNVL